MKLLAGILAVLAFTAVMDGIDRRTAPAPRQAPIVVHHIVPDPTPRTYELVCAHYQAVGQGWRCQ